MGGRFPALAVFGLPALTVAIALFVLWGLRPWEDDSADPQRAPLGIEMAVGDGNALSAGSAAAAVGPGTVVGTGTKAGVRLAESTGGRSTGNGVKHGPRLAISPGQAVIVATDEAVPAPATPAIPAPATPEAQPVASAPEAPAAPASVPIATTGEGTGPGRGPVGAGVGGFEESCEGDEYLLTVTLLDEEPVGDETPVDIVLERFDEDGTPGDELHLEGDLSDARSLASTLGSEGSCVQVEVLPFEGEAATEETPEAGEEVPGPVEETTEPAESPVPISP